MCQQIQISALVLIVIVAIIQNVNALQCWKCTSEYDVTCRDYFNLTRIHQNRRYFEDVNYANSNRQSVRTDPHLEHCDERFTSSYGQKNVCLKRVYTANNGMKIVNRECRLVSTNLRRGYCPDDLYDQNRHMEYCGTCDYDGCNAASGLGKNLAVALLAPVGLLLFFRK